MFKKKNKKGGVVTSTILGIGGLIIGTIVILVVVSTLNNASLLTSNTAEANATDQLTGNFTSGLSNVAGKLPTILLIVAVVFLFGALVLLIRQTKGVGLGAGSGSL